MHKSKSEALLAMAYSLRWPLLWVLLFLGISWLGYWWFVYREPSPPQSNPELQSTIPTLAPTPTGVDTSVVWDYFDWLSQEEARNLRNLENVVNLAFLEDGYANYSRYYTAVIDPNRSWLREKPFEVTGLDINDTRVALEIDGENYSLNVYQPFVLARKPGKIYVVDTLGQIWGAPTDPSLLISIDEANISIIINPNPNLSFTK